MSTETRPVAVVPVPLPFQPSSRQPSYPRPKCPLPLIRRRKAGEPPGGAGDITFKVAVDRFLLTPPYLAITLASLRLLQGLGAKRSFRETSALYRGVLFTNWKASGMASVSWL